MFKLSRESFYRQQIHTYRNNYLLINVELYGRKPKKPKQLGIKSSLYKEKQNLIPSIQVNQIKNDSLKIRNRQLKVELNTQNTRVDQKTLAKHMK